MKTILLFFSFLSSFQACTQNQFTGHEWVGHTECMGQIFNTRISSKSDTISLRFTSESMYENFICEGVKQSGNEIQFNIERHGNTWSFSGIMTPDNRIKGEFSANGLTHNCLFFRRLELTKEDWQSILGNYLLPSGDLLRVWENGEYLRFHSALSRQSGLLRKIGTSEFFSTTGERLQFAAAEKNQCPSVVWISPDGQTLTAQRTADFRIENHLILTSTDTIGASLYLPAEVGKHPACLIARGAGRMDRNANDIEAELFASYGIASLIFDNFGTGESTGNLREKDFADKRALTIELFRWLQKHPEIDPQKIGLRGGSQGGRVALMAATELPKTAFLILASTPLETRMDQQIFAFSQYNRQQHFTETAIAEAAEYWRQYFVHATAGTFDPRLAEAIGTLRGEHPGIALPDVPTDSPPTYPWPDDILSDARKYLPKIKCPVLAQYCSEDDRVPARKSAAQLEQGLSKYGNGNLEVIFYEGANHSFMLPGFRIAPGYFMDQIMWMKKWI